MAIKLSVEPLSARYAEKLAIQDITMDIEDRMVTAVIGPSGCGKSTLIRCLNRMHETIPKTRVEGKVLLQGEDIYAASLVSVRRRIGMVFQDRKSTRLNSSHTVTSYAVFCLKK